VTDGDRVRRDVEEALGQELRRGTLVLVVLALFRREQFGAEALVRLGGAGIEMEPGPLYPMLRRLEDQGLLRSERRIEGGRQKRFYQTTEAGVSILKSLTAELDALSLSLKTLLESDHGST
jgi:PadR family transcriptional regulator, regulatory protein PadR